MEFISTAVARLEDMANALTGKIVVWIFLNREKEGERKRVSVSRHVGSRSKLTFAVPMPQCF